MGIKEGDASTHYPLLPVKDGLVVTFVPPHDESEIPPGVATETEDGRPIEWAFRRTLPDFVGEQWIGSVKSSDESSSK